jgi:hypothetical protein
MIAVLKDGTEITHALYEKRKAEAETKVKEDELELPRLQKTLFPDFEIEFPPKETEEVFYSDETVAHILLRIAADFQKLALKLK